MRVALYARVSTEEQALHGLSIEAQLAALREAFPNGKEYVDLGISARSPIKKRPELQRLLRDVEAGKIDLIAFVKLDRWTRNIREYYKAQDILDAHNVAWKAIHEDYETQTAAGRLKVNIMLAVAQDEADRTSERVKMVFEEKRRKGLVPTGKCPLGIKIENGKYVPSEDAQKAKDIFLTFLRTNSVNQTARTTSMTDHGIRYLLRNPNYVEAGVIDQETFDTVQRVIAQRATRYTGTKRVYLFSGLLVCPYCGHRLSSITTSEYKYYRCPAHFDGKCQGFSISEKKVEGYLSKKLVSTVKDRNLELKRKGKKPTDTKKLRAKMDKLTDLYLNDLIDRGKYEVEFKSAQTAIEEAEKEEAPVDTKVIKSALEAYKLLSDEGKRIFWRQVVKRLTPKENGIEIELNYTIGNKTEDILTFVQNG